MGALLSNHTPVEADDEIGILDGGESVSNHDDSLALASVSENFVESLLHLMLRLSIKGTRCFIQEENLRLSDECSCNGYSLLLTTRKLDASFSNERVITVWKGCFILDELECICVFTSFIEFSFCGNMV